MPKYNTTIRIGAAAFSVTHTGGDGKVQAGDLSAAVSYFVPVKGHDQRGRPIYAEHFRRRINGKFLSNVASALCTLHGIEEHREVRKKTRVRLRPADVAEYGMLQGLLAEPMAACG